MTRTEHLLTTLNEEFNETAQRVSKALRFGLNEIQPGQSLSNAQRIIYEFNDIIAVLEMLRDEGHFQILIDTEAIAKKKEKVNKYLEFSNKCGTLSDEKQSINIQHVCSVCSLRYVEEDGNDTCENCITHRL